MTTDELKKTYGRMLWIIPGTEDMCPYIDRKDKPGKWLLGTVGFAAFSVILSGIMVLIM